MSPVSGGFFLGLPFRSYGVFAAAGMAVGLVLVFRLGRRAGLGRKPLIDVVLWVLLSSLIGAKLTFLLVEWRSLVDDPWTWVELLGRSVRLPRLLVVWEGGLVYYGGVATGVLAAALHLAVRRTLPLGRVADVIAPGLSLGHAWGRFGCFLAGCCYGKASSWPLAATFGPGTQAFDDHQARGLLPSLATATYGLHPVQLYEAGAELLISGALLLWAVPRRRAAGRVALAYLAAYSAARFLLELYRGDPDRGFLGEPVALVDLNHLVGVDGGSPSVLSVSQALSLVVLLGCGWLWLLSESRRRRASRAAPRRARP